MQEKQSKIGLVWFRNNLRIQDNTVLRNAINNHQHVIAIYCFDPRHFAYSKYGFKKTEKFRAKFLIETVKDLKENLASINVELFVYFERPEVAIKTLIQYFEIQSIYTQKEWTFEEVNVLRHVKSSLPKDVALTEYYDQFLYHPKDVDLSFSEIPQVFTIFRKHVEKHSGVRTTIPITSSNIIEGLRNDTKTPSLETLGYSSFEIHPSSAFPFNGGESSALARLEYYFFESKKLGYYKKTRNGLIGSDFSSKFSPWLANGSISPRTIYENVKLFEKEHYKNQSTYWLIFELVWRDYFKYISLKHDNAIFKIEGILQKSYTWNSDHQLVQSWIDGHTNSPFVNANMMELKSTGWMSNRGRQNVASYFAKELQLDWRIGAAYFEAMLIDYDVHSNYGNWMYVSGVGNDPRDRKFNVDLQAQRYDPKGKFQNLWLQPTLF